jgi:hypothetical protein
MESAASDCAPFDETVVFLSHFKDLKDPRQQGKVAYPLEEMLLCACSRRWQARRPNPSATPAVATAACRQRSGRNSRVSVYSCTNAIVQRHTIHDAVLV